jgi:hypothetical protein
MWVLVRHLYGYLNLPLMRAQTGITNGRQLLHKFEKWKISMYVTLHSRVYLKLREPTNEADFCALSPL